MHMLCCYTVIHIYIYLNMYVQVQKQRWHGEVNLKCMYRHATTILVIVVAPTVQQRCGDTVVAAAVGDAPGRKPL